MKTRIDRLEHPRIHIQSPPSRTAHLVSNMIVEDADEAKATCRQLHRDHGRVSRGPAAHVRRAADHPLRRDGDGFRIVQKRVDLINCDAAFEAMALPI